AQDRIRIATGLGEAKPRIAIADFAARSDAAKSHANLFTQVVRADLEYSGIFELASPSFYPTQPPTVPAELKPAIWMDPPTNANFLGFGNLTESTAEVAIEAWLYDVRNPSSPAVVGKVYRGAPTDLQVRKFAHQFADEIIAKLSGGLPGVAGTQIAFVSSRGGSKEIWVRDYDGTSTAKLDLPDKGYVIDPAWHPSGQLLAFSWRRPNDNYDLYIMDAATRQLVELTRDQGRNERPSWAPDGRHLVFESTRGGTRQIWTMLADGSQARQLTTSGHNESPNWSPK